MVFEEEFCLSDSCKETICCGFNMWLADLSAVYKSCNLPTIVVTLYNCCRVESSIMLKVDFTQRFKTKNNTTNFSRK